MHLDVNFSSHFLTVPVYCRALLRAAKTQAILHWEKEIQEHALRQPEASHKLSRQQDPHNQLILPVPTGVQ